MQPTSKRFLDYRLKKKTTKQFKSIQEISGDAMMSYKQVVDSVLESRHQSQDPPDSQRENKICEAACSNLNSSPFLVCVTEDEDDDKLISAEG